MDGAPDEGGARYVAASGDRSRSSNRLGGLRIRRFKRELVATKAKLTTAMAAEHQMRNLEEAGPSDRSRPNIMRVVCNDDAWEASSITYPYLLELD